MEAQKPNNENKETKHISANLPTEIVTYLDSLVDMDVLLTNRTQALIKVISDHKALPASILKEEIELIDGLLLQIDELHDIESDIDELLQNIDIRFKEIKKDKKKELEKMIQ